jgi:hypothetical protein
VAVVAGVAARLRAKRRIRLRAAWLSLIRCDLDLWEVREWGLTVAAMPASQSTRKKTNATIRPEPAKRFPEFTFLYLSPEFTAYYVARNPPMVIATG